MVLFPGYLHLEKVHEFQQSIIYRAQNEQNSQPVLIKQYQKEFSSEQLLELEKQVKNSKYPDPSLFLKPIDFLSHQNKAVFIFEDTGAMFLSVILVHQSLNILQFLNYAIKITQHLGAFHSNQFIHNDIRPQNILIDERSGDIKFTGLSQYKISASKSDEKNPMTLGEDMFMFTAPEQTGRINWKVDQRSDLYSLGITFYQMLCKHPPFSQEETQKRIHSHLAVEPASILTIHDDLPVILDQIVLKLVSKSSDDRYQSAFGLQKDLENCREQFKIYQTIKPFELAQNDNIERFHIPSKLYGSQSNIVSLIESFNRVCTGSVEMMIVKGKAGMGKTTLIKELLDLVVQKGGYIGQGKCEKEYRDTPYYSLIRAFQLLIREILSEDKIRIEKWKKRFLDALGHNGQMVIDFIPELELIIGPQPKLPRLDADETQNRLIHIFRRFIQAFTQEGNPLVIFLDSFHWADLATIQLIQASLSDISSRYIMLVIAYQKYLISHSHTFSITLEEIAQSGTHIQEIQVNPLNLNDINLLIEEALSFKQNFQTLAQYILDTTEGNPYFVKQLLKTLYDKKLVAFDPIKGQWIWDIKQINRAKISEDVIKLIADKVLELEPDAIDILKLAACIGNQFDLKTLSIAADQDEQTIMDLLKQPIKQNLIQVVHRGWRYPYNSQIANDDSTSENEKTFQFTHSRVLQAAYSLLKSKEKKFNHLLLGRQLLKNTPPEQIDQNTYKIVNQMNQGIQLIKGQSERHELARLNLMAGLKSKTAAAFETAWKYFSLGSELLSVASWKKDYKLTKELYLKRSECEYFIGNTDAAEPIFDLLLNHVNSNSEKVEVINLKLNLYIKNNRLEEAVEIGLVALQTLFKEKIPPNDAEITIVSQVKMQDIQADLQEKKIVNLLYLPVMIDTDKIAVMELITNIIPAAYIVKRNLWILLTLKMVEISLEHGNANSSAFGYMNYAVILCSGLQDYSNGYAMGQVALNLNNRFNKVNLISQLNFLFGSYIGHWKNKAEENLTYLKRSYQAGIEYGDLLSAGLSVDFLMKTHIIIGSPLEEILKEIKKHQDFVDQLNNRDLENVLRISQLMMVLRESPPDSDSFVPGANQLDELLKSIKQTKNTQLLQWYYLITAQIHYIFYNYKTALKLIQESDKLIASYSQLAIPEHYFYYSIIIIENYSSFSEEEKKRYWDILKSNHQKLMNLALDCSINFSDKDLIIAALMASVSGNYIKASDLFDEAIASAHENGFVQNEAIANELAAKYFLSKNKTTIAQAYIRKACRAYIKWGATAKIKHLEHCYPMLLIKRQRFDDVVEIAKDSSKVSIFSDLSTIVKASQEISAEIVLEKMIDKLLTMLLENTNAQKGFFLIEDDNHLKIITEGIKKKRIKIIQHSVPLEQFERIAQSVVFYVIRTRKHIVLDDASKDGMFAYNRYIKETNPKSILCIPVINHGKLNGILYLENTRSARSFSPKLVELLNLLISQVSISIENSMLYSSMSGLMGELNTSKEKLEKRIQILEQELESKIV